MNVNIKRPRLLTAITTVVVGLFLLTVWQVGIKPIVLTQQHGTEMHDVLVNYEKTVHSVFSHQNPNILDNVAQGNLLETLKKNRCLECPTIPVVINVNIEDLRVLEYSDNRARVSARIEIGVMSVNPATLKVKGPCRATATEGVDNMIKEDEFWKIIGGEGRADTWTPTDELRQKVCPAENSVGQ